ncbi:MAG: putative entry exclusion protein TrbK-alt [Stellaceae bacterium]
MRGRPLTIAAIGRAAGFALVAAAIVVTGIHFRHEDAGQPTSLTTPSTASDPLARELAHCQAIGMAAKDDAACEAAWAENRRRFFTYRPADSATSARTIDQKPAANPEDR